MVEQVLREVDPSLSFRAVHASRGKRLRAEPVAALYEQGRVRHAGVFPELEDEMCTAIRDGARSPDRWTRWSGPSPNSCCGAGPNQGCAPFDRRDRPALRRMNDDKDTRHDMLNRLKRLLAPEQKRSATGPLIALHAAGRPQWTPRNYAALAAEGFASNAIGYRAVRMIAEAAASIPWLAYEGETEASRHPLLALLAKPNPGQQGREFFEMLFGFCWSQATPIWRRSRSRATRARSTCSARSDEGRRLGEWLGRGLRILRQRTIGTPAARERAASQAVQSAERPLRHVAARGAQRSIDTHNAAAAWNKAMLDNAARPSGALVYAAGDGQLTPTNSSG